MLQYIDHIAGDDDEGSTAMEYAHLLAGVDAILTSQPLTSAFEGKLGRPSPADSMRREVSRQLDDRSEPEPAEMHRNVIEPEDDYGTVAGERGNWQSLLWRYSDVSMLYGAILMYRLLKGGVR